MNQQILKLWTEAGGTYRQTDACAWFEGRIADPQQFVELVKQAIYEQVRNELISDEDIAKQPKQFQEYLKGCNGGTVDALCHIKNFGLNIDL